MPWSFRCRTREIHEASEWFASLTTALRIFSASNTATAMRGEDAIA